MSLVMWLTKKRTNGVRKPRGVREREFAERQQPPLIVPERLRTASVGGLVTIEVSKFARTAKGSA
jgi:hypothetical protein